MSEEYFYSWPLGLVLLVVSAALLLAVEAGHYFGRRNSKSRAIESLLEFIPTTLLGLLALLLGFTFSMAVGRFDARKKALILETNAIETAWLRAGLLPDGETSRRMLVEYLALRTSAQGGAPLRSAQLRVWQFAEARAKADPNPVSTLFAGGLNAAFDAAAERDFLQQDHVPEVAYLLILVVAIASLYLVAYAYGCTQQKRTALWLLAVILSVVVTLIQDIDHPGRGLIRVSSQALSDLQNSLR